MNLDTYLKSIGFDAEGRVYNNLPVCKLIEHAIKKGEGNITSNGALNLNTGKYTGRSPKDRFIVDQKSVHNEINWNNVNVPIKQEIFDTIYLRLLAYFQKRDLYVFDGFAGADRRYSIPVRFINEMAAGNLFVHQLFIRPKEDEISGFNPEFTVIAAPGFNANPALDKTNSEAFVIINFEKKLVIIGGTMYCGEMKKSIFSVLNYLLPKKGVLPMHCSANIGVDGDTALFFGLSGTGKTTLSADQNRRLIGDDEHGWSNEGVFNFEGGCYAKCINLSKMNEPQIWDAIRFGTLVENIVINENGDADYTDASYTENTRAAYPIEFIPDAVIDGRGGHPNTIIFLTADAFGVLPPIAKLNKEQAMYHFMSGYTSKLAGTERGIVEPEATFSACFGEPFMPRHPSYYANMLGEKIDRYNADVYLVNTGWAGGPYGIGNRIKLSYTRAMVTAAIKRQLKNVEYEEHPVFKLWMPKECPNVPAGILNPINTWDDRNSYYKYAEALAEKFNKNFKKFIAVPKQIEEEDPLVMV